ncbi:hypothetical protein ACJZ2D_012351 [Fusarium nematophilum]
MVKSSVDGVFMGTHVDILGQKVVGGLVLLEEVAVGSAAREEAAEKETEESNRQRRRAAGSAILVPQADPLPSIGIPREIRAHSPSTESPHGFPGRQGRGIGHSSGGGVEASLRERAAAGEQDSRRRGHFCGRMGGSRGREDAVFSKVKLDDRRSRWIVVGAGCSEYSEQLLLLLGLFRRVIGYATSREQGADGSGRWPSALWIFRRLHKPQELNSERSR